MIKVKKSLTLLVIVFLVVSNIAFAQYPSSSDSSSYEGKPIDPSKEGKDYYREGQIIVYPAKMISEEERMMERFAKSEMSEEEMRRIAKAKFGKDFDEMEFKRGMLEFGERMQRKDTFSYEHEGYEQRYYIGPSYEGYSKEHMVFGMIFQHIGDDIDPREIKQYCNEPNKIADIVINKLKDKVGDIQNVCKKAEEHEAKCIEFAKKGCSQIGTALVREDATEMEKIQSVAYSCPVNKDAVLEACRRRSKFHMEQRLKNLDESCKQRFDFEGERLIRECERFKQHQVCDKEKYVKQCTDNFGAKREDFDESGKKKHICPKYPVPQCREDAELKTKTDANGCEYYYCIQTTTNVCPQDVRQCPDGHTVRRIPPSCNFEPCPTTTVAPPTTTTPTPVTCISVMPACASGNTIESKVDENGCVQYYCKKIECSQIPKPTCNTDETLQTYYDNKGCVTSYQCIKTTTCLEISKPTCTEEQSLTTKYDDKGCIVGYECISVATTGSVIKITGKVVLNTYDDFLRQCENNWREQERICSSTPNVCEKNTFIEKCKEQEKKGYSDFISNIEGNCETQTISEIRHAEQRCARIDEDRQHCFEQSTKRCEQMKGIAQKCREFMTEENIRKFIVDEAKKRCKFTDILQDEKEVKKAEKAEIVLAVLNTITESDIDKLNLFVDNLKEDLKLQDTTIYKGMIEPNKFRDIKLLPFVVNAKLSAVPSSEKAKEVKEKIMAGQKAEEAASKLVSLRDSDVPNEYLYIIEDKASEVLDVSDKLGEIEKKDEQKGLGYKVRLFLGLAKRAEQEEIKQLGESKSKLKNSIEVLTKLVDEVPSDVAKVILKEQVESLKKQQEEIEVLIETKEKKAKGLLGLFG